MIAIYSNIVLINMFTLISLGTGIFFYSGIGHIVTIGLLGVKNWEGYSNGGFKLFPDIPDNGYLGVIGFTGFHFTFIEMYKPIDTYFLGSALATSIDILN
jgi:hypothetical protein